MTLDRADYFEFKALTLEAQCLRLEAEKAAARADAAVLKAQSKATALGADVTKGLRFDDATCSLVAEGAGATA
jgi:hypothetical protein